MQQSKTVGISPKAFLAFVFPALTTLILVVTHALATGEWNETETRQAVYGLVGACLAFLGAYLGVPGQVPAVQHGPGSDDLLDAKAAARLND